MHIRRSYADRYARNQRRTPGNLILENPKLEILNSKQIPMTQITNSKHYDLEERTFRFAKRVSEFSKTVPRTLENIEYRKQLIRSSGSQAANYIEANEALSKKDFVMRIKICRKETKESELWLKLIFLNSSDALEKECATLIQESVELRKIFGSILEKSK